MWALHRSAMTKHFYLHIRLNPFFNRTEVWCVPIYYIGRLYIIFLFLIFEIIQRFYLCDTVLKEHFFGILMTWPISTSSTCITLKTILTLGCDEFVPHFDTVVGLTPNFSHSHLLVFFFSANNIFNLFMSSMIAFLFANIMNYFHLWFMLSYKIYFNGRNLSI